MVIFCVFDLSRSARFVPILSVGPGYELCDAILHSTRCKFDIELLMGRGEFASGEVLPSEKVTANFPYSPILNYAYSLL